MTASVRPLSPTEQTILKQLAEEFFGSVQAAQDSNLEGLEMTETEAFEYSLGRSVSRRALSGPYVVVV